MQILSGKLTAKQEFIGALHRILNFEFLLRQAAEPSGELGIILGFACDFELFSCELQQTRQTEEATARTS